MNVLLGSLVLALCVARGFACGAQEEPAGTRSPGEATPPPGQTPSPAGDNGALKKFMGDSAQGSPYDDSGYLAKGGGPITQGSDLTCNFDGAPCCWTNDKTDQGDWGQATGSDTSVIQSTLGTSTQPSGNYLWAGTTTPLAANAEFRLDSCTIPCTLDNVQVSLKHWQTDGPILEVCTKSAFDNSAPLQQCTQLSRNASPGPSTATIQPGDLFDIVIVARNFAGSNGGIVAIDDITVNFTPCPDGSSTASTGAGGGGGGDTTTSATGGNTPAGGGGGGGGGAPDSALCSAVQCNFDAGSTCSYKDATSNTGSGLGGTKSFQVSSKRTGNSDTGVPGPPTGAGQYAGVNLQPGDSAILYVTPISVTGTQTISFLVYEATSGVALKACINDKSNCPYTTSTDVSVSDRNWIPASFSINNTATQLIYLAQNTGNYIGAVGLDNIIIEKQDGSKSSACAS